LFPIPDELKAEVIKAYNNDETNYPPANGILELRESISRFLHTRGHLEYNPEQILVAGGARPLIYAAYQTLIDPGDTVVYPVPSWNNNHYSHLASANKVAVETKAANNFMPTAEELKPHISKANIIALCSPLNPTGTTFESNQLEAICDLVLDENRKRGEMNKPVYLLFDQVYWMLTYGDTAHHDPVSIRPEMKNYTIYIDGISKAFSATGLRVGWAFGPQKIMDKMRSILSHVGAWAPRAEQVGCAAFMQNDKKMDAFIHHYKDELYSRLNALYNGFIQLKEEGFKVDAIKPQAAMYLTVRFDLKGKEYANGTIDNNADTNIDEFSVNLRSALKQLS
jgi:aspartate aminotransferase